MRLQTCFETIWLILFVVYKKKTQQTLQWLGHKSILSYNNQSLCQFLWPEKISEHWESHLPKNPALKTSKMIWPHCVNRRRRNSILGRLLWHLNLTVKTLVYIIVHYSNRMFFRPSWLEHLNLWKFKLLIVKKNPYFCF